MIENKTLIHLLFMRCRGYQCHNVMGAVKNGLTATAYESHQRGLCAAQRQCYMLLDVASQQEGTDYSN
jgi:hypothetical protein